MEFYVVIVKDGKSPDGRISNAPRAHDLATSLPIAPNIRNLRVLKHTGWQLVAHSQI